MCSGGICSQGGATGASCLGGGCSLEETNKAANLKQATKQAWGCPSGYCDQTGMYLPTCSGGFCNQAGATWPTCSGGLCTQGGATGASCWGGGCSLEETNKAANLKQAAKGAFIRWCPSGYCDQTGMYLPTCSGGFCNQAGATLPTCSGGMCSQGGATGASCWGGGCSLEETNKAANLKQ